VGLQHQFMVIRSPALSYLPRQRQFIKRGGAVPGESERIGFELPMAALREQPNDAG